MIEVLETEELALRIGGRGAIHHGKYWMVCCPVHADKTPSLKIETGDTTVIFHCYAGCSSSDVVNAIYEKYKVVPWNANSERRSNGGAPSNSQKPRPQAPKPEWAGTVIDDAPKPGQIPYPHGSVETARWAWRDEKRHIVFWNIRADKPTGEKIFLPMSMYKGKDGVPRWTHAAPPSHPLYNLYRDNGTSPVMFVEGEKTADFADQIFGNECWCTTAGSSNSLSRCDLSPLKGRKIFISPDLDSPGIAHAHAIATRAEAASVLLLIPPREFIGTLAPGADLYDIGQQHSQLEIYANFHAHPTKWLHSLQV